MKRFRPVLLLVVLSAACGASPPRAEVEPATSALPRTPSREAVVRAMGSVQEAVMACARGAHGALSVALLFDSSGAVVDATINAEYSWASRQPEAGCGASPNAHGYYDCRRPHTPVPQVDECVVRAVRSVRVPPFTRPTFQVNYPFRY